MQVVPVVYKEMCQNSRPVKVVGMTLFKCFDKNNFQYKTLNFNNVRLITRNKKPYRNYRNLIKAMGFISGWGM
jgi:hypothetical protein